MRAAIWVLLGAALAGCGTSARSAHGLIVTDAGGGGATDPDAGAADAAVAVDAAATAAPPLGATAHAGGVTFGVWAPHADRAFVRGDFNAWSDSANELTKGADGVFAGDVAGATAGQAYAFTFVTAGQTTNRADPRARKVNGSEGSSVVVDPAAYAWNAADFTPARAEERIVYELHVGTFNAPPGASPPGTWTSAIDKLDHVAALGVNMIEVMPPAEFSGDHSWGYNPAFLFAPETAYGSADDMRRFVDEAHARGIGVLVDIVHNHWGPQDLPMTCFDGDCLGANGAYFYTDARETTPWGPRPDFGRPEVQQYIEDNALAWLTEYRCDGLRWDSVSNIRSTNEGDNPDGWQLLRSAMNALHALPNKLMVAEDLQNLATITQPANSGGAGFDTQWDAAFFHPMDDTCTAGSDASRSMASVAGAISNAYNGQALQRVVYTEDHDEVANGRARIPEMISPGDAGSLLARKISTLGAITVMTSPGIPMLFMGQEFLQDGSFNDTSALDWTRATTYASILALYTDLVSLRKNQGSATRGLTGAGTSVFHVNDTGKVIGWHRYAAGGPGDDVVIVANWSSKPFASYQVGLPRAGIWHVRFNSDDTRYGADFGGTPSADVATTATARDGFAQSGAVALGAYSAVILSQ